MEETISAGQRGRGCHFSPRQSAMNLGLWGAFYAFTFLLLYFVATFIIARVLRNRQDSISQSIPVLLL